jgi:Uma2 family endonuclease
MSTVILPNTPAAPTSTPPPIAGAPRPVKWTDSDFYRMENLPSLQGQKSMLIDGEILVMPPPSELSAISHTLVDNWLRVVFPATQFTVRTQLGMFFGINTDPVPDLAVVPGPPRAHTGRPQTALLVVEIADTSLAYDTGDKANLYAAAGITDYWVIGVNDRRLHLFRDPQPDAAAKYGAKYKDARVLTSADTISPLAAATSTVTVSDLLA